MQAEWRIVHRPRFPSSKFFLRQEHLVSDDRQLKFPKMRANLIGASRSRLGLEQGRAAARIDQSELRAGCGTVFIGHSDSTSPWFRSNRHVALEDVFSWPTMNANKISLHNLTARKSWLQRPSDLTRFAEHDDS